MGGTTWKNFSSVSEGKITARILTHKSLARKTLTKGNIKVQDSLIPKQPLTVSAVTDCHKVSSQCVKLNQKLTTPNGVFPHQTLSFKGNWANTKVLFMIAILSTEEKIPPGKKKSYIHIYVKASIAYLTSYDGPEPGRCCVFSSQGILWMTKRLPQALERQKCLWVGMKRAPKTEHL